VPVDKVQKLINAIDNNQTGFTTSPFISEKLRKLIEIPEPEKQLADKFEQTKNELKKQIESELKQTKDEFKKELKDEFKQQIKDIQGLLDSFVKNSNTNHNN
jgi:ElaB/YqjD/DUF883 family membrane-anchored ribosome-binding protein